MNTKKGKITMLTVLVAGIALLLMACQPQGEVRTVVETVVVTQVVEVEGQQVVVTEIVEVERIVTPEAMEVKHEKEDKSTLVITAPGEPGSLDPAWNYETAGNTVIMNVYETLVFYNRQAGSEFVPQLATDWTVSDDGMVYTFNIRQGVQYHLGGEMTASDVAYSFQRAVLQGGGFSPQWLLTEPYYGIGYHDVAELVNPDTVDDRAGLQAEDPAALADVCERTKAAIVADDAAGTVTITLAQPWGPFLGTIAAGWASVIDQDWAVAQGAWDGDCATWQNFYAVDDETAPLAKVMNGTGPYMFESWTPGEGWSLVRNDNYWRTEPAWEGGPSGPAAIERIVYQVVDEWGTRFAMLQAGDTDFTSVDRQFVTQVDPLVGERCEYDAATADFNCAPTDNPDGPLRLFIGHPSVSRTDAMFVFDINTEGGNPLIGSGALDGNGIPANFFSDINVRRAFNYCFDHDTFIQDALVGEAVQNVGVLIPGMPGYDQNGSKYSFDLDQCQAEIEAAWGGAVAENGFRIQVAFNTGNVTRQSVAQILQQGFQQLDAKYQIEIIGLPWPSFLNNIRASRLPVYVSGWLEDIHDPHNWAQPFTVGTYASRQRLPDDIKANYSELVDAGVAATATEDRAAIYLELQEYDYEVAPAIRLAVATGRHYEQRWVGGWYYNPIYPSNYYYSLSIK
ncbi:MAG: ABC transporter substrate-binding protein [Anaerolineae bacterium]|nr:ABC transporter substrate-binding protein [Anaerolineae bacterium]